MPRSPLHVLIYSLVASSILAGNRHSNLFTGGVVYRGIFRHNFCVHNVHVDAVATDSYYAPVSLRGIGTVAK